MTPLKSLNFISFSLVILSTVQFTSESHDALLTKVGQFRLKRNIVKRSIDCLSDEYSTGSQCCKLCPKGKYKRSDCDKAHGEAECVSCKRGKDYMDHENNLIQCERCRACDHGQGLEVWEYCTDVQNAKCRCMKDYFCNSTAECNEHCHPCEKCENGVERECTPNHNTVCKAKGGTAVGLIGLLVIPVLGIIGFIIYKKIKQRNKDETTTSGEHTNLEEEELLPENVDLQPHLLEISKKFKKKQMLAFVRTQGFKEPETEAILNDNQNNEEEQKFKLLESWYQKHGKTRAYQELIRALRGLKFNALVDEIKGIVSISNDYANVQSSSIELMDRNESEVQGVEEVL